MRDAEFHVSTARKLLNFVRPCVFCNPIFRVYSKFYRSFVAVIHI